MSLVPRILLVLMLSTAAACAPKRGGERRSAATNDAAVEPPTAPAKAAPPAEVTKPATVVATKDVTRRLDGTGVQVRELVLDRGGVPMSVWIYRATAAPAKAGPGLPVVLIAAAGTPLFWGMALAEEDRVEHLPWAQHGYVVVAYSLDGPVADRRDEDQVLAGVRAFLAAHAGLDNARAALDFALAHEPGVDPAQVYAVGHSSAATLALRFAAEDERVKAVVAFAPVTRVEAHIGDEALRTLDGMTPDASKLLAASSPMSHVAALRTKPVYLFHAIDDGNVPVSDSRELMAALAPAFAGSQLEVVPTGDHYDSMLHEGVPRAIEWLGARRARR
jgi:dienelactone hydrolase